MKKTSEKYPDISTNRTQRMVIWIICIVMAGGTILAFFLPMIFAGNPDADPNQIAQQRMMEEYMKEMEKENNNASELSKNYEVFGGYEKSTFDADKVTKLVVETIKEGKGEKVSAKDKIKAYYTGWTPNGNIFDTTKSKGAKNEAREFALNEVIKGWTEGLAGKKVGGVYKLTIPSDMAYGEYGAGTMIPPNTPLQFIVEIVSKVK